MGTFLIGVIDRRGRNYFFFDGQYRSSELLFIIATLFDKSRHSLCYSLGSVNMKRKLDTEETPFKNETKMSKSANAAEDDFSFTDLDLDPRLIQAVAEQKFLKPTLVQRKAIPVALKGQDVLCKAKTGSGKTAAYVLPVVQAILKRKTVSD